jgi:hypothetical protein
MPPAMLCHLAQTRIADLNRQARRDALPAPQASTRDRQHRQDQAVSKGGLP